MCRRMRRASSRRRPKRTWSRIRSCQDWRSCIANSRTFSGAKRTRRSIGRDSTCMSAITTPTWSSASSSSSTISSRSWWTAPAIWTSRFCDHWRHRWTSTTATSNYWTCSSSRSWTPWSSSIASIPASRSPTVRPQHCSSTRITSTTDLCEFGGEIRENSVRENFSICK